METTTTPARAREDTAADDDLRVRRLAEMVQHLSDCSPTGALHAVKRAVRTPPASPDDALAAVAHALVAVKRGKIDLRDQIELD
jgi:hypothetical protein